MINKLGYDDLYKFLLKRHGQEEALEIVLSIEGALRISDKVERSDIPLNLRFNMVMEELDKTPVRNLTFLGSQ